VTVRHGLALLAARKDNKNWQQKGYLVMSKRFRRPRKKTEGVYDLFCAVRGKWPRRERTKGSQWQMEKLGLGKGEQGISGMHDGR